MQIVRLTQWFSRQKRVKLELKGNEISVTSSIAIDYETFSYLAYLPPTATLVIYTRAMRGTL